MMPMVSAICAAPRRGCGSRRSPSCRRRKPRTLRRAARSMPMVEVCCASSSSTSRRCVRHSAQIPGAAPIEKAPGACPSTSAASAHLCGSQRPAAWCASSRGASQVERRLLDELPIAVETSRRQACPAKKGSPGRRPQHPADHLERCRLAGAVGARAPITLRPRGYEGSRPSATASCAWSPRPKALGEPARLEQQHGFVLSPGAGRVAVPARLTFRVHHPWWGAFLTKTVTAVETLWRQLFSTRTPRRYVYRDNKDGGARGT